MSIVILALIVVIVVAMLIYAVDLVSIPTPFAGLIKVLIILVGVLVIMSKAGLV